MTILAIEFSSPLRSVSVFACGRVAGRAAEQSGRETNAFALINAALREAAARRQQVDCIAVGLGPGSYAGIRIAIAIAQGWHLATGIRVAGYSSADCVANQIEADGEFTVVMDAQRGEFFGARYRKRAGKVTLIEPFRLMADADWQRQKQGEVFLRPDVLESGVAWRAIPPDGGTLGKLAAGVLSPTRELPLTPIYLRPASFVKAAPPRFLAPTSELK